MVGGFAAIGGADRKNEVFKQRPFLIAHQVSGQAGLHSRYQLESRLSQLVNPFCQHGLGSLFNLRDLLGDEWPNDAGAARKLGRDFRAQLGEFEGVIDEGRDNENLRWYRKQ